jgi:hypothetical protein
MPIVVKLLLVVMVVLGQVLGIHTRRTLGILVVIAMFIGLLILIPTLIVLGQVPAEALILPMFPQGQQTVWII